LLVAGSWLLVTGSWSLVAGHQKPSAQQKEEPMKLRLFSFAGILLLLCFLSIGGGVYSFLFQSLLCLKL